MGELSVRGDIGEELIEIFAQFFHDTNNRWVRRILEMLQYWKARDSQPYLVNGHHHFSPLASDLGGVLFRCCAGCHSLCSPVFDPKAASCVSGL